MSIRLALIIVVRSLVDMFALPLDPKDAAAVQDYLDAGGNVDTVELFQVAHMKISAFASTADEIVWGATKDALWQSIVDGAGSSVAQPTDWTLKSTVFDVAMELR